MNDTIATSADHDKAFEIIHDVQLVDLTYRDAQFVRAELADKIAQTIAAAVQAERENGRIVEVALRSLIEEIDNFPGVFDSDSESVIFSRNALEKYEDIQSAAIRASGEVTK